MDDKRLSEVMEAAGETQLWRAIHQLLENYIFQYSDEAREAASQKEDPSFSLGGLDALVILKDDLATRAGVAAEAMAERIRAERIRIEADRKEREKEQKKLEKDPKNENS